MLPVTRVNESMEQINIVGVQFRRAGKIYDFAAGDHSLRIGDSVVVETERGPSLAKVAKLRFEEQKNAADGALKKIVRRASVKDLDVQGKLTEEKALSVTQNKVNELNLDMRVLKADVQFSGNKVIVFFSAPGRVDFRDLVKELATGLKARVELKQVGARDEAKLIGGMGICGREFCCSSFLREFVPVSIKMAKNQNLALNPTKISGGCGRLLCCLNYENDTYTSLRRQMPSKGTRVKIFDQFGDVIKSDFINQLILVELDDGTQQSFAVTAVEVVDRDAGVEGDDWGEDLDLGDLTDLEGEKSSRAPASPRRPERSTRTDDSRRDQRPRQEPRAQREAPPRQEPSPARPEARGPAPGQQASDASGERPKKKRRKRNRRKGNGPGGGQTGGGPSAPPQGS